MAAVEDLQKKAYFLSEQIIWSFLAGLAATSVVVKVWLYPHLWLMDQPLEPAQLIIYAILFGVVVGAVLFTLQVILIEELYSFVLGVTVVLCAYPFVILWKLEAPHTAAQCAFWFAVGMVIAIIILAFSTTFVKKPPR